MGCWTALLVTSGCMVIAFTISLSVSVVYLFDVEKDNLVTTDCSVQSCNILPSQCPVTICSGSGSNRRCTTYEDPCYIATIIFTLNTTDRTYIGTDSTSYPLELQADGRCNDYQTNSPITCYYDMRTPGNTLGLNPARAEAGGIAAIVIFTVFDTIALVLFILSIIFCHKPNIRLPRLDVRTISISICFNKKIEKVEMELPPV